MSPTGAAVPVAKSMSSDGRSTRPCALTAYPPATPSPYLEQTGSAASTSSLWSPSSTVALLPRTQLGELLLPDLPERPRQPQPTPVAAQQAGVQPAGVVLPRNRRGQHRHVVQVALPRIRQVEAPVTRPGEVEGQLHHAAAGTSEMLKGRR